MPDMAAAQDKSSLKRARDSTGASLEDTKKARRADRLNVLEPSSQVHAGPFLSPVTRKGTEATDDSGGQTLPPFSDIERPSTPISSPTSASEHKAREFNALLSPPRDTQPYSQFVPPTSGTYEVEDEEAERVWGYLIPTQGTPVSDPLVLKPRTSCPVPESTVGDPDGKQTVPKDYWTKKEQDYEKKKSVKGTPASGYLLGRHQECDRIIHSPTVSNRHCLIWSENRNGDTFAVVEDLSGNGTYVNNAILGRNNRRELQDGDEIDLVHEARFTFRYPRNKESNRFHQEYNVQGQLGKGHFATVYLAFEKKSGKSFAVKKFEKRRGPGEKSKTEGLKQEIAVLMSVSHPNMLCLKNTFDEPDGVYLVLELAPEGELFNWIVMKQKLTEAESRKIFIQLFQGVKYLVSSIRSRNCLIDCATLTQVAA
jgi:serine/threonine-protein kinase Chk2